MKGFGHLPSLCTCSLGENPMDIVRPSKPVGGVAWPGHHLVLEEPRGLVQAPAGRDRQKSRLVRMTKKGLQRLKRWLSGEEH